MATINRALIPLLSPQGEAGRRTNVAAPAGLLRCLLLAADPVRRRSLRLAAEIEAWEAISCRDAAELLRESFLRSAPLILIDLPPPGAMNYEATRKAAEQTRCSNSALMAIAGQESCESEELWARQLGAWAYFCEAMRPEQMRRIFHEARTAVERLESLRR